MPVTKPSRREFLKASLAGPLLHSCMSTAKRTKPASKQDVVVLGFDGVDPRLVERWMASGELPNLTSLIKQGSLLPLGSTSPPNSPVAWCTFATGLQPGQHGVFGFLRRDPKSYVPALAPLSIYPPKFSETGFIEPRAVSNLQGAKFWDILDSNRIPVTLLFVPYAYPPPKLRHGRVLSGLGTPDLRFTNSSFTYYTTESGFLGKSDRVAGGRIVRLSPTGRDIETHLEGPHGPGGKFLQLPVGLELDRSARTVRIRLGGQSELLAEGKRSGWLPVSFEANGLVLAGRIRFHLLEVRRELKLYASPIQLDPRKPALPLGTPPEWVIAATEVHGGLPTVGWANDTSAVNAGVLPEDVFLADLLDTMEARTELILREIGSGFARLLVGVFTGTDRASHIFYRDTNREDGGRMCQVYRAMDRIVGKVRARIRPTTRLVVLSDHGFHPFDRMLHVNTWLESQGWLTRASPGGPVRFLRGIDWEKTQAYSLENGQLYLNLKGREVYGMVPDGAPKRALIEAVRERLLALRDPVTGQRPVRAVYDVAERAALEFRDLAPDLQIAFAPGYRSSWQTSLGGAPLGEALAINPKPWCGDHACSDYRETPGILITDAKLLAKDPELADLPATLLDLFGQPHPGPGRPLWG